MKSLLHNKKQPSWIAALGGILVSASLMNLWPSVAHADQLESAMICLEQANLPCAVTLSESLYEQNPNDADVLKLRARTLFHLGEFEAVVSILDQVTEQGVDVPDNGGFPARASLAAFTGMVETKGTGIIVRHDPGIDRVLVQDALNTMGAARLKFDAKLGGGPEHDVILDIFPTAKRFMQASGIPEEAVRTTGVIALSKWNRLLITSPKATSGGYPWMDTSAHEYIHLVVSWRTKDKAPVWLQEGLARYLEKHWREDPEFYLSSKQQTLLATALVDDAFVPFEKFRLSMAYLDSGEEAALAYAQVSTMVDFMVRQAGEASLIELMDRIAEGESAEDAVSGLAGFTSFQDFKVEWRQFVATLPLVQQELTKSSIVLDGEGGDFADDPVLQNRTDLAKHVRIGDLLMEHQKYKAALVEYKKSEDPDEPMSPTSLSRMAECYFQLGDLVSSNEQMIKALTLYGENIQVLMTAGRLASDIGLPNPHEYWLRAHEINPYNIEIQRALILYYQATNNIEAASHHESIVSILKTGGLYTPSLNP